MEETSRAYYEAIFEKEYLKRKGNAFQDLFSEIMEKCHLGDFQRVRPWGKIGDQKNDGYLKSERTIYQVYAPNEMSASKAINKIEEDFTEAIPHWEKYFDTWIFVHNSRDGLSPEILKKLLDFDEEHTDIKVGQWGYEEIRNKVFMLNINDLASLFGPAPSDRALLRVGFNELKIVLDTIAPQQPVEEDRIMPVSKEKLTANALSPNVNILLKAGMRKAKLVENFFDRWPDPTFGDTIASTFNSKYSELKSMGLPPNQIFFKLHEFTGGARRGPPDHESAVLAVLAYLFERCDIFENPTMEEAN